MSPMEKVVRNLLIGADQTLNCVVWFKGDGFGSPDETLSARAWRLRSQSNLWKWINRLMFLEPNHCQNSYGIENRREHLPDEYKSV